MAPPIICGLFSSAASATSRFHQQQQSSSTSKSIVTTTVSTLILWLAVASTAGFYAGLLVGMHSALGFPCGNNNGNGSSAGSITSSSSVTSVSAAMSQASLLLGPTSTFAAGMSRVNRQEFFDKFDMGLPIDPDFPGNEQVLVLQNAAALKQRHERELQQQQKQRKERQQQQQQQQQRSLDSKQSPPLLDLVSADDATRDCNILKMIHVSHNKVEAECVAIVGQYESYHIQKWMRLPPPVTEAQVIQQRPVGRVDSMLPLRMVNRGSQSNGRTSMKTPTMAESLQYWRDHVQPYLSQLESTLEQLRPIAERVASANPQHPNTIIVMVCNWGQSELLLNFLCHAQARQLDVSNLLVFATDDDTKELMEAMNVAVFYDETNFANLPVKAARAYGDRTFTAMMLAKIFCVQLLSMLEEGYHLLFQDVDLVWFKNPLPHLERMYQQSGFDIYFQDDGSRGTYYAPYSANTGFYYIRHSLETAHLFRSLVWFGDVVQAVKSHQIALIALLSEHASLFGLRIKILDWKDFPGGNTFHRRWDYMKEWLQPSSSLSQGRQDQQPVHDPFLFHMSWTRNKDDKILYLRQLGEWHVQPVCVPAKSSAQQQQQKQAFLQQINSATCCSAVPLISCHYKDKPSKIPCPHARNIDVGRRSFWK